ncbi:MAG: hypothetical protein WBP84_05615 [Nitrososphaeraceae archaeon]
MIIQNLVGPPMEKNHLVRYEPCSGAVYEMSFVMEIIKGNNIKRLTG